jgi:hypothetical protein
MSKVEIWFIMHCIVSMSYKMLSNTYPMTDNQSYTYTWYKLFYITLFVELKSLHMFSLLINLCQSIIWKFGWGVRGRGCGRDRMVVGFSTTYAIPCLSPLTLRVRIPLRRGVLDTTLYDKLVSDFRRSVVFSGYSGFLHQ